MNNKREISVPGVQHKTGVILCRDKPRLHSTETEFITGDWQQLPISQNIFPPGPTKEQLYMILSPHLIKFSTYDFFI